MSWGFTPSHRRDLYRSSLDNSILFLASAEVGGGGGGGCSMSL